MRTALVAGAVLLAACAPVDVPPASPPPPAPVEAAPDGPSRLVIVLPPADGLAPGERVRVRLLVERVVADVLPSSERITAELVDPADRAAAVAAFERAVRRVGPGGTVCALGADLRTSLGPTLARYPATRGCLLPHGASDDAVLATDVDLEQLGRRLGVAARAAAGTGTVLILDGGDALLDARWRRGVVDGALEPSATMGAVHTVRSAEEALALIDDQAALIAEGIVPGGVTGEDAGGTSPSAVPGPEDRPSPRTLPPVRVVVLDASPEAALLAAPLAERGIGIVAPRSVLASEPSVPLDDATVVLGWLIRWDVALRTLVEAVASGAPPEARPVDELFVLEPGGGAVGP